MSTRRGTEGLGALCLTTAADLRNAERGGSDGRQASTTELVKAVFTAGETGFLDNAPDRTVVEGQSGMLALLTRQQGQ
ncbi:MAG: hypothetical protein IPJ15_09385 [Actinomycetales bacterium]|nr:hypothetical protein [Candidatus Phosphoribacter baldrii]HRC12327.1 hypothetical protein [Dermatophilaceae bacterium]